MVTERWVFDLGACHGEDTRHYLRRGCKVVAVEANPQLIAKLRDRFREAISTGRVVLIDRAIGRQPGRINFAIVPGHDLFGTTTDTFVERFLRTGGRRVEWVEVETVTLAQLLET